MSRPDQTLLFLAVMLRYYYLCLALLLQCLGLPDMLHESPKPNLRRLGQCEILIGAILVADRNARSLIRSCEAKCSSARSSLSHFQDCQSPLCMPPLPHTLVAPYPNMRRLSTYWRDSWHLPPFLWDHQKIGNSPSRCYILFHYPSTLPDLQEQPPVPPRIPQEHGHWVSPHGHRESMPKMCMGSWACQSRPKIYC